MLRNNPGFVKDSVNEATEVLSGMLNTHKCLLESGVEIQKKIESHTASKRMGIFRRPRSASLGDIPKKPTKGEKRVAPSPLEDRLPIKGKGGTSPTYKGRGCCRAVHRAGQARTRGPVQAVQALRRCADCGGPFNRGGRSELVRVR